MPSDRSLILGALAAAAVGLTMAALLPGDLALTPLVEDRLALTFLAVWTLSSLPLAFAMPLLRARFFSRMWRVPSLAYAVPRWIVWLLLGMILAQVVATIVVAALRDGRLVWLAGSQLLIGAAFGAGAWLRLRHRPDAEWVVHWWPRM